MYRVRYKRIKKTPKPTHQSKTQHLFPSSTHSNSIQICQIITQPKKYIQFTRKISILIPNNSFQTLLHASKQIIINLIKLKKKTEKNVTNSDRDTSGGDFLVVDKNFMANSFRLI